MDKKKLFEFCLGRSVGGFPATAVVTPFIAPAMFSSGCRITGDFKGQLYSGITASRDGEDIAVVLTGMGGLMAGDAVLLLAAAGVKRIIFAGSCGGLNDCCIGDIVVCDSAFAGDGFTRYHGAYNAVERVLDSGVLVPADAEYATGMRKFLLDRNDDGFTVEAGDIFTIGSLAAEEDEAVRSIEDRGFKGIDMDLAAVYHAARVSGVKAAGLVYVSDLPVEKPLWGEMDREISRSRSRGLRELVHLSVDFAIEGHK